MTPRGSRLALGLVGCGGMGTRHLHALWELERAGLSAWDLVAVCDIDPVNAAAAADLAAKFFGRRPAVFSTLEELVTEAGPDAVDIVTVVSSHHELVTQALAMGVHVMVEKPLAISMKAAKLVEAAAARSDRLVSVAENYRRDPMNRLVKAVLDSGALGAPKLLVESHLSPGGEVLITPWRHDRRSGGILLEIAVHYADILQYFLGVPVSVLGRASILEPVRVWRRPQTATASFYDVANRDAQGEYRATAEDSAMAMFDMADGAAAQWSLVHGAGGGQPVSYRRIYCEAGTILCPGDRSGEEVVVHRRGAGAPLAGAQVLDLTPGFRLGEPMANLFGADRLGSYELEFNATDAKITASEYWELAHCIAEGTRPEVGIAEGRTAMAAIYGLLESSVAGEPVSIADVLECKAYRYQAEIDEALGIG